MADDPETAIIGQIQGLFDGGATGGLGDGELLERFGAREGPAADLAFGAIVDRHGPMVFRVARSIVGDPNDAADAFQATFLALARKAESLRSAESVGPWLHRVTCRVASGLRASASRRREKERQAPDRRPASIDTELADVLDTEIDRLPDRYRAAVVLCLVEGLTQEQAAIRLGWPSGTVRSRLARGRERLQDRLSRRGIAPSAIVFAIPPPVESELSRSATRAAIAWRSGGYAFSSQLIRSLSMNRIKVAATLLLTTGLGAAGVYAFGPQKPAEAPVVAPIKAAKTRWSYKAVAGIVERDFEVVANFHAKSGWEIDQVVPVVLGTDNGLVKARYMIVFRRPAEAKD